MSFTPRRPLTPEASRKRKEREAPFIKPAAPKAREPKEPPLSNRLLAGYMAYEFLTKGTLLGQEFDPARAEAVPVGGSSKEPRRIGKKPEAEPSVKKEHQSYGDVARILKTDGAHVPGIVNPTELARWIQM